MFDLFNNDTKYNFRMAVLKEGESPVLQVSSDSGLKWQSVPVFEAWKWDDQVQYLKLDLDKEDDSVNFFGADLNNKIECECGAENVYVSKDKSTVKCISCGCIRGEKELEEQRTEQLKAKKERETK